MAHTQSTHANSPPYIFGGSSLQGSIGGASGSQGVGIRVFKLIKLLTFLGASIDGCIRGVGKGDSFLVANPPNKSSRSKIRSFGVLLK